jgi:hypothetical protein
MTTILKQLFKRFTPPMLRSDSPNRPMVVRRRHWLLQETRFLFLTRKGPVEIILKPSLIIGAGFVGVVGMTVIGAVTLFVGFKSVEVVRNESISTAIASAPPALDEPTDKITAAEFPTARPAPIVEEAMPEGETALAVASVPSIPELPVAIDSLPAFTLPDWSREPTDRSLPPVIPEERALADNYAEPEDMIPIPDLPLAAEDDSETLASAEFPEPSTPDVIDIGEPLPLPQDSEVETIAMYSPPSFPEEETAGLEPLHQEAHLPVVTMASRQYKLLRSMAREVRGIRDSLLDLGFSEDSMPTSGQLNELVETADFASLAMAVEDHRSMLRKIPLKPPMLYFYISSHYGMRTHPVLKSKRFHHGIDLAGTWQEEVQAPAPGTVIFAGRKGSFGKVVQVRHAYGVVTTYAHLAKITVRRGADVVTGSVVGKMGRTGRVDGAHLHYEIRIGDKSLDPKRFFAIGHRIGVGGELMMVTEQP